MERGAVTGAETWTAADILDLRHRVAAGASHGAIARATGRSRNAIIGKLRRLKLKTHNPPGFLVPRLMLARAAAGERAGEAASAWSGRASSVPPLIPANAGTQDPTTGDSSSRAGPTDSAERGHDGESAAADAPAAAGGPTAADAGGVPFLERGRQQCAWPRWGEIMPPVTQLLVCGQPVAGRGSYCAGHRLRIVAARPDPHDAAAPARPANPPTRSAPVAASARQDGPPTSHRPSRAAARPANPPTKRAQVGGNK